MKSILPVIAVALAATVFASPVMACERHQSHTAMTTVEVIPAPVPPAPTVVIEPAAQSNSASKVETDAMSQPLGAAYGNCNRMRKDKTVYLTQ